MQRVLITGANRGIGLALARAYAGRGDLVFASCRNPAAAKDLQALASERPQHLVILRLDVTEEPSIAAAVAEVEKLTGGLDVLINSAAVYPRGERPDNLDEETMLRTFHVNAVGPLTVVRHCLSLLRAGSNPRIVNLTSTQGSLTRKASGRAYSYSASKAALNMLTRALAFDLQPEGIIAVVIHPGWVQTDMGGDHAAIMPGESASGIIDVTDRLTPEQSSKFLTWDGREHVW